jgi:hypothetical protein
MRTALHEVVEKVFIAVLITRLRNVFFGHDIVISVVPLPGFLFPLFGNSCFLLPLFEALAML